MSKCLFKKELRYVSYDMGNSWQATGESRKGSLIAQGSSLCPEPTFQGKFKFTYSGGTTYSAECDSNTTLSSRDTTPSGYDYYSMTSAEIGDCITTIGNNAFEGCTSLTSITIPNSVTSIGAAAFGYCDSLLNVELPNSLVLINVQLFEGCTSLTSITIPDSVTSIDYYAFFGCSSLTSCTIGSGVTNIGSAAFGGCTSLTSITIEAVTPPTIVNNAFNNTNNAPIYVPSESVSTYQSAWSTYASRIQAIP